MGPTFGPEPWQHNTLTSSRNDHNRRHSTTSCRASPSSASSVDDQANLRRRQRRIRPASGQRDNHVLWESRTVQPSIKAKVYSASKVKVPRPQAAHCRPSGLPVWPLRLHQMTERLCFHRNHGNHWGTTRETTGPSTHAGPIRPDAHRLTQPGAAVKLVEFGGVPGPHIPGATPGQRFARMNGSLSGYPRSGVISNFPGRKLLFSVRSRSRVPFPPAGRCRPRRRASVAAGRPHSTSAS